MAKLEEFDKESGNSYKLDNAKLGTAIVYLTPVNSANYPGTRPNTNNHTRPENIWDIFLPEKWPKPGA